MRRLIPCCLIIVCICTSISFGAFDHTITNYYDDLFEITNESLLVNGDGVKEIDAKGISYVEVQNTLPLQPHIGGIERVDLWDTSSMNLYGGEVSDIYLRNYTATLNVFGGKVSGFITTIDDNIVTTESMIY